MKFLYRPESSASKAIFTVMQQDLGKLGLKIVGVPASQADFYVKYLEVPSVAQRGVWDISLAGWGPDWYGDAAKSFFSPLYFGTAARRVRRSRRTAATSASTTAPR